MSDPKWFADDKALVADCNPDGTPKTGMGSLSVAQNAALKRAHAHIDEWRKAGEKAIDCVDRDIRLERLLNRQEPPEVK